MLVGERVWIWEAAWERPWGTAAEHTVVPARQTVLLGAGPSFEVGAALGIPFLTAHRCLTVAESLPDRIGPGSLTGRTVLVQGGAGAVGNAAIQLARWADATVVATVSGPQKAQLAAAAGVPGIVTADMVKPGAAVLDVGVSRVEGKLAGDVAPEVWDVAGWVSPNPGGVGPMTRAMLLSNHVEMAEAAGGTGR